MLLSDRFCACGNRLSMADAKACLECQAEAVARVNQEQDKTRCWCGRQRRKGRSLCSQHEALRLREYRARRAQRKSPQESHEALASSASVL